jgi:hypothetical protein
VNAKGIDGMPCEESVAGFMGANLILTRLPQDRAPQERGTAPRRPFLPHHSPSNDLHHDVSPNSWFIYLDFIASGVALKVDEHGSYLSSHCRLLLASAEAQ